MAARKTPDAAWKYFPIKNGTWFRPAGTLRGKVVAHHLPGRPFGPAERDQIQALRRAQPTWSRSQLSRELA